VKETVTQRLEYNDRMSSQFGLNRFSTDPHDWYPVSEKSAARARELKAAAARGRAAASTKR